MRYTICKSEMQLMKEAEKKIDPQVVELSRNRGSFKKGNKVRRSGKICTCNTWGCIVCMQRFIRSYYGKKKRRKEREELLHLSSTDRH